MFTRRQRALAATVLAVAPLVVVSTVHAADALSEPATVGQTADRGPARWTIAPSGGDATASQRLGREASDLVNAARARRGLSLLAWDGSIAAVADAHSADMATRQRLTHTGSDGSNLAERLRRAGISSGSAGESIGAGQGTARQVVDAWIASPGHADILFGDYLRIGVAVVYSASGVPYWTLIVAR